MLAKPACGRQAAKPLGGRSERICPAELREEKAISLRFREKNN